MEVEQLGEDRACLVLRRCGEGDDAWCLPVAARHATDEVRGSTLACRGEGEDVDPGFEELTSLDSRRGDAQCVVRVDAGDGADHAAAVAELDVDVALECSGSRPGLASAIRGTRPGGRVVMVGLQPAGEQPTLLANAITRELELVGSFRFRDEIDDVVTALGAGLSLDAAITHEVDVTDTATVLDAFGTARDASVSGKVLLRF